MQRESWASTIRWRGCSECLPHETIEALPPDGIALQVAFSVEHPPVAKRTARWPPTIRPRDVGGGFEGVSSRYGVFQLAARFGAVEGYVWVFFGRAPDAGAARPGERRVSGPRYSVHLECRDRSR